MNIVDPVGEGGGVYIHVTIGIIRILVEFCECPQHAPRKMVRRMRLTICDFGSLTLACNSLNYAHPISWHGSQGIGLQNIKEQNRRHEHRKAVALLCVIYIIYMNKLLTTFLFFSVYFIHGLTSLAVFPPHSRFSFFHSLSVSVYLYLSVSLFVLLPSELSCPTDSFRCSLSHPSYFCHRFLSGLLSHFIPTLILLNIYPKYPVFLSVVLVTMCYCDNAIS